MSGVRIIAFNPTVSALLWISRSSGVTCRYNRVGGETAVRFAGKVAETRVYFGHLDLSLSNCPVSESTALKEIAFKSPAMAIDGFIFSSEGKNRTFTSNGFTGSTSKRIHRHPRGELTISSGTLGCLQQGKTSARVWTLCQLTSTMAKSFAV